MNQKTNKTRAVLHHAKAKRRFTSAVHARGAGLARDSWSNPEKPIRRSPSTSPPLAGLAQTPAGGGRAVDGGGRARVRVSALWAARRARQSITGQVLPGGSATRALPRAHPRARLRRPLPCGPPDGGPRPKGGPGLVPHSPKSKERVRVQKVGPGEVSPSLPDHGMSNSPQRSQGYVYILNQGFYFVLCSRIILALRLTIVHVERNLCINFSNSLRSQFFSTVFL
ncbi:uncharacterized protein LOC111138914 [Enhydra lutris kenyoni]|uniref:Uncharacterized protein LOC111138914 n=1 Tax=Enhydra lutris kenyoni TaxID=391180 RepID=A0A2Y9IKW7_ENHLU|nr:uncharacterized protein LOC111138914 [Enhydra lutris kenyoni]